MNAQAIVADVLLGLAAVVVVSCSIGVYLMGDVYQRLHFVTPISILAPILVAVAVTVRQGYVEATGQSWLTVLIVVVAAPILSHATIRAARSREHGDWRASNGRAPVRDDG